MKKMSSAKRREEIFLWAIMAVLLISYFIGMHLLLMRQFCALLGGFGQYLTQRQLAACLNTFFDSASGALESNGRTTLQQAGYANIYILLLKKDGRLYTTLPFVALCLGSVLLFYRHCAIRQKQEKELLENLYKINCAPKKIQNGGFFREEIYLRLEELQNCFAYQQDLYQKDRESLLRYMEDIFHQLKTPLAALRVQCEQLVLHLENVRTDPASHTKAQGSTVDAWFENSLRSCLRQIDRMTDLLRGLLQLGRLDCNRQQLQFANVTVHDLLDEIACDLDVLALEKGVRLVFDAPQDLMWYCDAFWMKEALENVLKNCIQYTDNGTVSLQARQNGRLHQITIQDEGCGFAPGVQQTIFERYAFGGRLGGDGTGLGLAIARQVLQLHFGSIVASNRKERGAVFFLQFPGLDPKQMYDPVV